MAEKLTRTYKHDENTLYQRAKKELETKLNEKLASFNPKFDWNESAKKGNFDIKGVKGIVLITGSTLTIELDIPFLLKMFKGRIVEQIEHSMNNIE